jgi:integrase
LAVRTRHYSRRTEEAYVMWVRYGSGLRLMEALTLRIKDVDFARGQITVRDPKWKRDRTTMLPRAIDAELREQVLRARAVHEEDLAHGWGSVWLPDALALKFPSAPRETRWQWVFPAPSRWRDRTATKGGIICTRRSCSGR